MTLSMLMARTGSVATRCASSIPSCNVGAAFAVGARRSMGTFKDREAGEETVYMRREDKKLLEKLLDKMKKNEDGGRDELMSILSDHKLPEDVIQKILDWKHH